MKFGLAYRENQFLEKYWCECRKYEKMSGTELHSYKLEVVELEPKTNSF